VVASCDQVRLGSEIESKDSTSANNQHMVQLSSGRPSKGVGEGKANFPEGLNINLQYNELTDVMFVDLLPLEDGSRVATVDIGDRIGFPGQLQVRVDMDRQIFYGLTIQNYSGFRRKLLWRYRMWSMQSALYFLINMLMAGLNIDRHSQRPALGC
jgi:hypothetical protein